VKSFHIEKLSGETEEAQTIKKRLEWMDFV